jgi:hypothetical protein
MKRYAPHRSHKSHELTLEERRKAAEVVNSAMTPAERKARGRLAAETRWSNTPNKTRGTAA